MNRRSSSRASNERKYCLTKHYAKLMRLGHICSKEAEKCDNATAQDLIQYFLEALEWNLRQTKTLDVTLDWLEKQVPVILGRREVALTVNDLVTDVGREALVKQELQSVVDAFQSYPTMEAEFTKGQYDADPVEEFKRRHSCESKAAQLMTDLLYDVLAGTYDGRIGEARAAAQGKSPAGAADVDWHKAKGFDTYRELYRLITLAQSSVDLEGDDEVPKTATRQLRRYRSDPQGDEDDHAPDTERQEAYAAVQRERAKYVEILEPNGRAMTEAKYQQLHRGVESPELRTSLACGRSERRELQ